MRKTNIDMWYGAKPEQVTGLDIYFNELGGFYAGNLRIFGKIVGDYYADSVQDIEKAFPHLAKYIENCLNQPDLFRLFVVPSMVILPGSIPEGGLFGIPWLYAAR